MIMIMKKRLELTMKIYGKMKIKISLVNEPEKVRVAIEGYSEHTGLSDITERSWYE